MSPDPVAPDELDGQARNAPLTRPRPGHADLAGMQKFGHTDARPILERASARETAARVALGEVARQPARARRSASRSSRTWWPSARSRVPDGTPVPGPGDAARIDADPVRCADAATSARDGRRGRRGPQGRRHPRRGGRGRGLRAAARARQLHPVGPEARRRLAAALMSIQAIKGVEFGDGFAPRAGAAPGRTTRSTSARTGCAGAPTGPAASRAACPPARCCGCGRAMKPISTVPRALETIDVATGEAAKAINQRSDVTAVPAAGVVAEAMVALVLAEAATEKFGGDSVEELRRNARGLPEEPGDLVTAEQRAARAMALGRPARGAGKSRSARCSRPSSACPSRTPTTWSRPRPASRSATSSSTTASRCSVSYERGAVARGLAAAGRTAGCSRSAAAPCSTPTCGGCWPGSCRLPGGRVRHRGQAHRDGPAAGGDPRQPARRGCGPCSRSGAPVYASWPCSPCPPTTWPRGGGRRPRQAAASRQDRRR